MSTPSRLLHYLTTVRNSVFGPVITANPSKPTSQPANSSSSAPHSTRNAQDVLTIVMGNPSADLDSFISAVVVSWFLNAANNHPATSSNSSAANDEKSTSKTSGSRTYVPLLNLTEVKSSELWRLRPEYGTALRLATGGSYSQPDEKGQEQERTLLDQLMTIADIKAEPGYALYSAFSATDSSVAATTQSSNKKQALFLVDHNAPVVAGMTDEEIKSQFEVIGCIDHHVDEKYVSPDADPRIIKLGIGSCASLVIEYLWKSGKFPPAGEAKENYEQIAKLALAPILIDTSNLKAKGDKCSDTDRAMVAFLESHIQSPGWNRDEFHHLISETKSDSLKLLTPAEMFDRDFKDWTERNHGSGREIKIGISSLVKPVTWIAKHGQPAIDGPGNQSTPAKKSPEALAEDLVGEILSFVQSKELGVLVLLTKAGHHRKEIVAISFCDEATDAIEAFGVKGKDELQLGDWLEEGEDKMQPPLVDAFNSHFGEGNTKVSSGNPPQASDDPSMKPKWRIWYQHDTSKSRKQVGPMMRDAVAGGRSNM